MAIQRRWNPQAGSRVTWPGRAESPWPPTFTFYGDEREHLSAFLAEVRPHPQQAGIDHYLEALEEVCAAFIGHHVIQHDILLGATAKGEFTKKREGLNALDRRILLKAHGLLGYLLHMLSLSPVYGNGHVPELSPDSYTRFVRKAQKLGLADLSSELRDILELFQAVVTATAEELTETDRSGPHPATKALRGLTQQTCVTFQLEFGVLPPFARISDHQRAPFTQFLRMLFAICGFNRLDPTEFLEPVLRDLSAPSTPSK